jgi:hypothetical protein
MSDDDDSGGDDAPVRECKESGVHSIAVPLTAVAESGRKLKEDEEAGLRGEDVRVVFTLPDASVMESTVSALRAGVLMCWCACVCVGRAPQAAGWASRLLWLLRGEVARPLHRPLLSRCSAASNRRAFC